MEPTTQDLIEYARRQGTGYLPDPSDPRDYVLQAAAPVEERTISYRKTFGPIRNQGQEGSCVGFAATAAKEYLDNTQRNSHDFFSPEFLYRECKKRDGIPNTVGTYPRTAMQVLQKLGVPREGIWPYGKREPRNMQRVYFAAEPQRIKTYARLYTVQDMIASLLLNGPFVIGVWITEGWYTKEAVRTGVIDDRYRRTNKSGAHALAVIGYDKPRQMFELRNSWGPNIYDGGYNWVSKQWLVANLTDAWSIVDDIDVDRLFVITRQTSMDVFI